MIFEPIKVNEIIDLIRNAKSIAITAHKSPDGDSIGSSLALYHFIKKLNIKVEVCHPDPVSANMLWLAGSNMIRNVQDDERFVNDYLLNAELIFCLDYNALHRTGELMGKFLENAKGKKILIDHHLHPTNEFDVLFSDTSATSTAQMVYEFIEASKEAHLLDDKIGTPIYCGIMTDSGSFRFPNTSAKTHRILSGLLDLGVNHTKIHEAVYDNNTIDRLKLNGYAISEKILFLEDLKTVIISLTQEELKRFNYKDGYTDGIVNIGLSIEGINKSIFLKESEEYVKMSFRSKGENNPINELASEHFNGGGHKNASGGRFDGNIDDAIKKLYDVLPKYC